MVSNQLVELDSRTVERQLSSNPLLILPVGALEAHGPHLPLGADQIQAEATARGLAERTGGLVAPTIAYGSCPGARRFPGTVSISMSALGEFVSQVLGEFIRSGFRRILVLSGHAERGHMASLREAAERTMLQHPQIRIVVLSDYDFVYELRGKLSPETDGHAGLLETSRLLAIAPHFVRSDRPSHTNLGSVFVPGSPSSEQWPESVQGDTRPAAAELGQKLQDHVLARLEATVRELLPP